MIISRTHRYVFVELPYSASTAIAAELCEMYGGTSILYKHAKYVEFLRVATPAERQYFVFSCIRNPLDEAVSHYFRYKTNHDEMFTNGQKITRYGISKQELRMYDWIQQTNPTFPEFLTRAYRIPHDNWSALSHREFDFIIRFENLQADFAEVLKRLGLAQVRPLPVKNKTGGKDRDYLAHYTRDVIPHAKYVFGHFMREWGYDLPAHWGAYTPSKSQDMAFAAWRVVRKGYWRYANRTANPLVRSIGVRLRDCFEIALPTL